MAIMAQCPTCKQKRSNKKKVCSCGEDLDKAKRSKRVRYYLTYRVSGKLQWEKLGFSISEAREKEAERKANKNISIGAITGAKIKFEELSEWFLALEHIKAKAYHPILKTNLKNFNETFGDIRVCDIKKNRPSQLSAATKKIWAF